MGFDWLFDVLGLELICETAALDNIRTARLLDGPIVLPNSPGTIDADYRGELRVILANLGDAPFTVKRGDRIAQLVIAPVIPAELDEVETLEDTARGSGGFGHTGVG